MQLGKKEWEWWLKVWTDLSVRLETKKRWLKVWMILSVVLSFVGVVLVCLARVAGAILFGSLGWVGAGPNPKKVVASGVQSMLGSAVEFGVLSTVMLIVCYVAMWLAYSRKRYRTALSLSLAPFALAVLVWW